MKESLSTAKETFFLLLYFTKAFAFVQEKHLVSLIKMHHTEYHIYTRANRLATNSEHTMDWTHLKFSAQFSSK